MAEALRTKDIPAWQAKKGQLNKKAQRAASESSKKEALPAKSFSQLTPIEKDKLLEILALQAGLIDPEE